MANHPRNLHQSKSVKLKVGGPHLLSIQNAKRWEGELEPCRPYLKSEDGVPCGESFELEERVNES